MKKRYFIISRYNEDYKWIEEYTKLYIVYNKGEPIHGDAHIINIENIGANQRDIFLYLYKQYMSLPEVMIFIQANPFDHCKKELFDKWIKSDKFVPLEFHGTYPANAWERRDFDGGFMEINNSWYIGAVNQANSQTCRYKDFDEFMHKYFEDYEHLEWIKFAPGSQYLITKNEALQYPQTFWKALYDELGDKRLPTEGHIIERALYLIFTGRYKLREEFYEQ